MTTTIRYSIPADMLYVATDALARLAGTIDAATKHGCPLTLEEVQVLLTQARSALWSAVDAGRVVL